MFILCSISDGLEFLSVNHTSIYENPESKVFKNIKFLGEISNNWPNDCKQMYTRPLNHVHNHCWQYDNGLILL